MNEQSYKVYITMRTLSRKNEPIKIAYETRGLPWLDIPHKWLGLTIERPGKKYCEIKHHNIAGIHEVMIYSKNTGDQQRLVINPEIITIEEMEMLKTTHIEKGVE